MRFGIICGLIVAATIVAALSGARAARSGGGGDLVVLAGDSTVAAGSGWGNAYCAREHLAGKTCLNLAVAGASTKSFRESGQWTRVLDAVKLATGARTWVLIQFGHNDQPGKGARSTDLAAEFPANIARFATDVAALGAVPILVTPLSRRHFVSGRIRNSLAPWAAKIKDVAAAQHVPLIDLNSRSAAALNAMGPIAAQGLGLADGRCIAEGSADITAVQCDPRTGVAQDETHLGPQGAAYFATMVADLIVEVEQVVLACEARLNATVQQPR